MLGAVARRQRRTRHVVRVGRSRPQPKQPSRDALRTVLPRRRYTHRSVRGGNTVKHLVMTVAAAAAILAAVAFVGSGYLHTRRAEREADHERAAVHAMTQQDLAAAIARCDAVGAGDASRDAAARRNAAYCEEVAREMDNRPLEIVEHKPSPPALP